MIKIRFKRRSFDSCLYFREEDNIRMVFLLLYVDDMFLTRQDIIEIIIVKLILHFEFDINDLSYFKIFLGISIYRNRKNVHYF